MMIVGQVSSPEEATEVEFIAKSFVVANRARALALQLREVQTDGEKDKGEEKYPNRHPDFLGEHRGNRL